MRIIHEEEGEGTSDELAEAWSSSETFALIARKTGVEKVRLEEALERLPPALRHDHFCLLTSGTTGIPKVVVGARARAEALCRVLHEAQDSEPVCESIGMLPVAYSYAFVNHWLWARVHQRRIVTTRGLREPDDVGGALDRARAAMVCLVPSQFPILFYHFRERSFPGVIRLHFAGGRFPEERLDDMRRLFPEARVFNNYGCAEAMPRLCVRRVEAPRLAGDVGRPLPGVTLDLSAAGELSFRSPYRAVAEIDARGLRAFEDAEWLPTGDLAEQAPDGSWAIGGRANDVFKRYGERVSVPGVLGAVGQLYKGEISHHRDKDRSGEDGYVLVLCPAPDEGEIATILRALRGAYPRSQWPLRIESVAIMPRLPSGKPDVRALPSMAGRITHWDQRV